MYSPPPLCKVVTVPLGVILKIIPSSLPGPPAVTPHRLPSLPWTTPPSGLPPPPNRYNVLKVWAGNDGDAQRQSAANTIEIPDLLVMASNVVDTSMRNAASAFPQIMATSCKTARK